MARAKALDHHEKKARILSHASNLFVAEGFSRVSMIQLANACEISKSNLYHYYQDKEEILFNLLDQHMDEILHALQKGAKVEGHTEQFDFLIKALLELYKNADHKHRVLLNDLQILPKEKQEIIREKERDIVQYFKQAILMQYPQYAMHPQMLSAAAMTLLGSINWTFTWFKEDRGLTVDDYAKFVAMAFRQGLGHFNQPNAD